jgi:putative membrane protein
VIDWSQWHNRPLLADGLVVLGWVYALFAGPLRPRLAPGEAWPGRDAARFYSGLVLFYLAVGSPLDRVGRAYLFSLHIVLQLLVMYPAAALCVSGAPRWMIDPLLARLGGRKIWAFLFHPLVAGGLFVLLVSGWYVPRIFGWALTHRLGQTVEGAAFFAAAVLFWWPLISRSRLFPPISFGAKMIYLFCLEVALTGIFSYVLMAEHPLYPIYETAPRLIPGLSAEGDQVLGGVLLSGISSLVLVGALGVNFMHWARTDR